MESSEETVGAALPVHALQNPRRSVMFTKHRQWVWLLPWLEALSCLIAVESNLVVSKTCSSSKKPRCSRTVINSDKSGQAFPSDKCELLWKKDPSSIFLPWSFSLGYYDFDLFQTTIKFQQILWKCFSDWLVWLALFLFSCKPLLCFFLVKTLCFVL